MSEFNGFLTSMPVEGDLLYDNINDQLDSQLKPSGNHSSLNSSNNPSKLTITKLDEIDLNVDEMTDVEQKPVVRVTGAVRWYNSAQGFGFIRTEQFDEDILVRQTNITKSKGCGTRRLIEGQVVSFELVTDQQGGMEAFAVEIEKALVF